MRQNEIDDDYERQLREEIANIQRMYQRAIDPLVKELVRIEAMRIRPMYITPEQAEQLRLMVKK